MWSIDAELYDITPCDTKNTAHVCNAHVQKVDNRIYL